MAKRTNYRRVADRALTLRGYGAFLRDALPDLDVNEATCPAVAEAFMDDAVRAAMLASTPGFVAAQLRRGWHDRKGEQDDARRRAAAARAEHRRTGRWPLLVIDGRGADDNGTDDETGVQLSMFDVFGPDCRS